MFDLPETINNALAGSMNDNTGVKLPFAAPLMWWKNGDKALLNMREILDTRRFGGWGISLEDVENQPDLMDLPAEWQQHELTNAEGKDYSAYLIRGVYIAPIARRFSWFKNKNGASRNTVNILGYLGTPKDGNTIVPWGPVVLSGSAYSGKAIDDAIKQFSTLTASLRNKTQAQYFYHPLGTWGATPKFEQRVSKSGGASSSITPCQLHIPEGGYTLEHLKAFFVGQEVAMAMVEFREQAREWLDDWRKRKDEKQQQEAFDETPPMPEEDFSF